MGIIQFVVGTPTVIVIVLPTTFITPTCTYSTINHADFRLAILCLL
jgi:hypothetical protein